MNAEHRVILLLGRECIRARRVLLDMAPLHPDINNRVAFASQTNRVMALWDCYKMVYERLFHQWPKFQLRFY